MTQREQINTLNATLNRVQDALRDTQHRYADLADAVCDIVCDLEAGRPIGRQTAETLCRLYHAQHEETSHETISTPSNH